MNTRHNARVKAAPACSASELFPVIDRIVCPGSSVVTLVASSAICRNLCARDVALSAFVCGGPVPVGVRAAVNAAVSFCFAASSGMPSADATEAASEVDSDAMTSVGEVPRSSESRMRCTRSPSAVVVAAAVDDFGVVFAAANASTELVSVALKIVPFALVASGVASFAPACAVPEIVGPELGIESRFKCHLLSRGMKRASREGRSTGYRLGAVPT